MAHESSVQSSPHTTGDALRAVERYQAAVLGELRSLVPERLDGPYPAMRYHFGWEDEQGRPLPGHGGKLLRPALCLLACEAVGGEPGRALPAAAGLELLHNFTLIHDDIEDESALRHGRPTVWRVWGRALAINAGDGMFALARLALLRLEGAGHPPERVLNAARLLDEAALRLCEGQHQDLAYAGEPAVNTDQYLSMIEGKTGALLGAACGLGALLGEASVETVNAMKSFGCHLGLAFQIRDDVLGIWGDERLTGKPAADDVRARKKSYPVVVAFERAGGAQREELARLYAADEFDERGARRVVELLEQLGAREGTERAALEQSQAAVACLRSLDLQPECRRELEDLAAFAARRAA